MYSNKTRGQTPLIPDRIIRLPKPEPLPEKPPPAQILLIPAPPKQSARDMRPLGSHGVGDGAALASHSASDKSGPARQRCHGMGPPVSGGSCSGQPLGPEWARIGILAVTSCIERKS